MTVPEEDRDIELKAESDAAKIINLVNQPPTRWLQEMVIFNGAFVSYLVLKAKIIAILRFRELGADKSLAKIVDELKLTYDWVDEGIQQFRGEMENGVVNIPLAFYLDFHEKTLPAGKVPKKFYRSYFLLALVELVSFEELRLLYEELADCDGPKKEAVWYKKSIVCLSALVRAQSAVELGSDSLERSLGNKRFTNQLAILDENEGVMKAREGIMKYNSRLTSDAKKKWSPLVKEVDKILSGLDDRERMISKVCKDVAYKHEVNKGTLRNNYIDYRKYPSKYE